MISMSEICRRAQVSPTMGAEAFDLDVVFANARQLSQAYVDLYGEVMEELSQMGFAFRQ